MDISVDLDKAGRKAYLTITDVSNAKISITEEDIRTALKKSRIEKGILEETLFRICTEPVVNTKYQIAEMIPPKVGPDARILIKVKPKIRPTYDQGVDADKKVDHYGERAGYITYVEKGTVLATRIPPKRGDCGYTVRGQEIKGIFGKDFPFEQYAGRNARIKDNDIIATESGIFNREGVRIHIDQCLRVENDLGIKTGSIILPLDADIEMVIPGDITAGFTVQCRKITVWGTVEDAKVTAKILEIKRGIVGTSKLPIEADHLTTSFINGTRIIKAKYLNVAKDISAGTDVQADFVRSRVIQECNIVARYGVWVDHMYGRNNVLVGVNLDQQDEYNKWAAQLDDISKNLSELKTKNHSLLRKAQSIRDMAKRMPKNPKVQDELAKVTEAISKIQKSERLKDLLEKKIEEHFGNMYVSGSPFILVTLGFTKGGGTDDLKPINTFTIRDITSERNMRLINGLYTVVVDAIMPSNEYNIHEIRQLAERIEEGALSDKDASETGIMFGDMK
jgi:uncharacterized protein (DUF342 family)